MENCMDAITVAGQLGRLDFVSALLASIGIILALGVFPFYATVRRKTEKVAKNEANEVLKNAVESAEKAAIKRMESELPKMVQEYMEIAKNFVSDDIANRIAEAQRNGENDNDAH